MSASPITRRLFELQLSPKPDPEELAFIEEYVAWKEKGGPAKLDAAIQAARLADMRRENLTRWPTLRNQT
jgi:hypothetical protein